MKARVGWVGVGFVDPDASWVEIVAIVQLDLSWVVFDYHLNLSEPQQFQRFYCPHLLVEWVYLQMD